MIHRHLIVRPWLTLALLAGIAAFLLCPAPWRLTTRLLTGWNAAVWLYLAAMAFTMARADTERIQRVARLQYEGASTLLTIITLAAVASLAAIISELAFAKSVTGTVRDLHFLLAGATILGSWLLMPMSFAMHYANRFYGASHEHPPLQFPERPDEPGYWDFLYVSFTIAVAAQTADVAIASPQMRKVVLGQSLLAFLFNTSILAFSVNIAASLF